MEYRNQLLFGLSQIIFLMIIFYDCDLSETNYKRAILAILIFICIEGYVRGDKGPFGAFDLFKFGAYKLCLANALILIFLALQNEFDAKRIV